MSTIRRHPVMASVFGVILAAVVAFSLYLGASTTTASEGKKFIEFEGTYEGGRTLDDSTPGVLLVMTTDDGDATTFGSFTRTGFLVEDRTNTPKRCTLPPFDGGATGLEGLVTYAFADDILILKRTGAEVCLDFDALVSDVLIDLKVVGGTGRFEGAIRGN